MSNETKRDARTDSLPPSHSLLLDCSETRTPQSAARSLTTVGRHTLLLDVFQSQLFKIRFATNRPLKGCVIHERVLIPGPVGQNLSIVGRFRTKSSNVLPSRLLLSNELPVSQHVCCGLVVADGPEHP
jgi:hypothetical protein